VMEVDIPRKRVGLSMRLGDTPGEKVEGPRGGQSRGARPTPAAPRKEPKAAAAAPNAAMAALFASARQLRK
jgi:uncharacterized protein